MLEDLCDTKNALRNRSLKYNDGYPKIRKLTKKKTLKQLLSLPHRTADAAIYILLSAESIQQIIHRTTISLFLRIAKDQNYVEYRGPPDSSTAH